MKIESIAIGDELLSGSTVDTNLSLMAEDLASLGLELSSHTIVGDSLESIASALHLASERSDVVIVSGGLGPTRDDVTREAAVRAFKVPLKINAEAFDHIQKRFRRLKREMAPTNKRQAMFPEGSAPLKNEMGTAWGFRMSWKKTMFFFIPGVPRELHWMLGMHILPFLVKLIKRSPLSVSWLKVFGLPESRIDDLLKDVDLSSIKIGFYPHFPEVHLKLTARGRSGPKLLIRAEKKIRERLGMHIFGRGRESMEEVVGKLLARKKATVAVAESCTGGYIVHRLTDIPGSSRYVERGFICYSDLSKRELLGVKKSTLKKYGAVSQECALEMARGAKLRARTTYGVSVTGIAGPSGGTKEKPVGTVYLAISGPGGDYSIHLLFPGTREQVKLISSEAALELLRQALLQGD